jgi:hypothetical protein
MGGQVGRLAVALLVAAAASVSGCSYIATTRLDYAPAGALGQPPAPTSIAVVPLAEERPERSYPVQFNRMFLTYVPLIPYVSIPYERLDESYDVTRRERGWPHEPNEHFTIKMAEAMANDLRQSGLVEDVRFAPEGTAEADYVLSGTLKKSEFDVNATSYMLGMPGVLLWLLPIPIGSNTAEVEIDLALRDRSGRTVWQYPLRGNARKIFTLYNSSGAPVSNVFSLEIKRYGSNDKGIDGDSLWAYHADALRSGMGEAKASLAQYLATQAAGANARH